MSTSVLHKDNSQPKMFLEALQVAITNRVENPYSKNAPVVFEFTQDAGLLHQYYGLRQRMYRNIFGGDDAEGAEDMHDKLSHILIARRGNLCLGGCRLTVREQDEMWSLPMESEQFKLREVFADLPLSRVRHGEVSRFAVMEDCGEDDIFEGLCKMVYAKVADSNIPYVFAKLTLPEARSWRTAANSFGVKTTRICNALEVPEMLVHPTADAYMKWCVTVSDMSSYCEDESGVAAAKPAGLSLVE